MLAINEDDELGEEEALGFDSDAQVHMFYTGFPVFTDLLLNLSNKN